LRITVLSDIHYASEGEQIRRGYETRIIRNRALRLAVKGYRHFVWLRDPLAHNHLLDAFLAAAGSPELVVANGDYSCDSAFVGVSDDAACESARLCLGRLRERFGADFAATLGDHELGKVSLVGGQGGLRLASWHRATSDLGLEPFWQRCLGRYVLLGLTSTLLAFPVYEPESLEAERPAWQALRETHLQRIREAFGSLPRGASLLLFLHDPTALPYLWQEPEIRDRLGQVESTIIGHLHSRLVLWKSRRLAGLPPIRCLGNSIRRMSEALSQARCWREFNVHLCPALAGVELLKDGGFLELDLGSEGAGPILARYHRLPRVRPAAA
jgi:hypothetical protein